MIYSFWTPVYIFLAALCNEFIRQCYSTVDNPECFSTLCSDESRNMRCSCHKYCYLYNECCSDMVNYAISQTDSRPPSFSCKQINKDRQDTYFVYGWCPRDHPIPEHIAYCEYPDQNDPLLNTPALGKRSKRLYRNLFCALCNDEEYILWTILYGCNQVINKYYTTVPCILKNNQCNITFEPPEHLIDYQYQCMDYISNCSSELSNRTSINLCLSEPMAIVKSNGIYFRNFHCAVCNGVDIKDIQCNVTLRIRQSDAMLPPSRIQVDYNNNTVEVFNFSNETESVNQLPDCSAGFIFDIQTKGCRQVDFNSRQDCTYHRLKDYEDNSSIDKYDIDPLHNTSLLRDPRGISICNNGYYFNILGLFYSMIQFGLFISVAALSISIVVFFRIPELHTLPGRLLINVFLTMLITKVLAIIWSFILRSGCPIIGIFTHYFLLSSFFWLSALSFNTWYTFSSITHSLKTESKRRFILYTLYANVVPLVIVVVSLILQYDCFPDNHQYIACYMYNLRERLIFIEYPMMIILFCNLFYFFLTVKNIYHTNKNSAKYLGIRKNIAFRVYYKLGILVGFSWLSIIIGDIIKEPFVYLLGWFVNSFFGLKLSISFLTAGIVKRHFHHLYTDIHLKINSM